MKRKDEKKRKVEKCKGSLFQLFKMKKVSIMY